MDLRIQKDIVRVVVNKQTKRRYADPSSRYVQKMRQKEEMEGKIDSV